MKPRNGNTIRASISLEPDVLLSGQAIAKQLGFRFSFSAYVNELIKKDIKCRLEQRALPSASTLS
jgi:hypothetical protein